jgi:hypothetical protein
MVVAQELIFSNLYYPKSLCLMQEHSCVKSVEKLNFTHLYLSF